MKMQPWHQRVLVAVAAAAIFLAASNEGQQAETRQAHASAPPTPEPALQPQPAPALRVELERLARPDAKADAETKVGSAFSVTSWYVPPPPPSPPPPRKPTPPPPPTAPPMPYSYLGRYVEDGKQVILLVRSERIYTVSEGEVLENTYRVERLMRGWLEMTYLPLNIKQTIGTGET
ncbi:MAG: hypothetical protein ROZ09_15470 [Thiobacillus sp.]|uniref:hypothetical protein n=1 Tax=Thiobacillus sp. TaxID=924 RepID=UPI002895C1C6|nr:hypothetical protein [Thiobacillus sp.]MDT3708217.1 hypothetical protein [Thiobacillus sp.]